MSYTLGEVKESVLHKMREYSNSGNLITEASNKDYLLSMIDIFNNMQMRLATTVNKISRNYEISQFNPDNLLGYDFMRDTLAFEGSDISYSANGATAYSFEVNNDADIYIEEKVSDSWEILETINHTATDRSYTHYKGLITPSDSSNDIRIRFSGSTYYVYRYVALFGVSFSTVEDVPDYAPYVEYDLPDDFYKLDYVDNERPLAMRTGYSLYKLDYLNARDRKILFNYMAKGNFIINYYAYPTKFPFNPDNLGEYDEMEFDVPDECINSIIDEAVSVLLSDENAYMADRAKRDYYTSMNELDANRHDNLGTRKVIDNTGGW